MEEREWKGEKFRNREEEAATRMFYQKRRRKKAQKQVQSPMVGFSYFLTKAQ